MEASGTAIAIRGKDGVVFAVEKIITSKLYEKSANRRVFSVDSHVGMTGSGLYADGELNLNKNYLVIKYTYWYLGISWEFEWYFAHQIQQPIPKLQIILSFHNKQTRIETLVRTYNLFKKYSENSDSQFRNSLLDLASKTEVLEVYQLFLLGLKGYNRNQ